MGSSATARIVFIWARAIASIVFICIRAITSIVFNCTRGRGEIGGAGPGALALASVH